MSVQFPEGPTLVGGNGFDSQEVVPGRASEWLRIVLELGIEGELFGKYP
jgi:hypothetical protein